MVWAVNVVRMSTADSNDTGWSEYRVCLRMTVLTMSNALFLRKANTPRYRMAKGKPGLTAAPISGTLQPLH